MNYWMETIALPQEQVQHTASIDILSYGEKMSAITPLHDLLTVGVCAWEYLTFSSSTPDLETGKVVETKTYTLYLNMCMNIFYYIQS